MPKRWELKENSDAGIINGKRNRGSGNRWYAPGDVKSDRFLFESKDTERKSFTLTKNLLNKIYDEALFAYRIPVFSIRIQDVDVVLMFREDWQKLVGEEPRENHSRV